MACLPYPFELRTERLILRPFTADDVDSAVAIQSNWNVTRNLRMAIWPPTHPAMSAWLATHAEEWRAGTAYRFALQLESRVIGCCDLDEIDGRKAALGYWLNQALWGQGLATEAARAVIGLARSRLGVATIETGHADDNPASGRVLRKLGFRFVGKTRVWSAPREIEIVQRRYRADLPDND